MTSTTEARADFIGAKAAFFCAGRVLTLLRDDIPGLPWAGWWDLPGGGREGDESGEACVLRELHEEFGLRLGPERLVYRRLMVSMTDPARMAWLFGGHLTEGEIGRIVFGDEGERWEMMPVADFLAHGRVIPEMQRRAGMVWEGMGQAGVV